MEFHIAHEQMVQGRKRYLIPLLLDNVKPCEIKDADLRMYVESHTYLDCGDQVVSIDIQTSEVNVQWGCFVPILLLMLLFEGKYEEKAALRHAQSAYQRAEAKLEWKQPGPGSSNGSIDPRRNHCWENPGC